MSQLASLLRHQSTAIIDGALGTELERRGIVINNCKLWSASLLLQDPAVLEDIHYQYFTAGADIGTTSTYQASVSGFQEAGVSPQDCGQLFLKAVQLCDAARERFWRDTCDAHEQGEGVDDPRASEGPGSGGGPRHQQGPPDGQDAAEAGQGSGQGAAASCGPPSGGGTDTGRRRHRPLVAYSCGAYGACLADGSEFTGAYADSMTIEQLMAFHRSRLEPIKGHPSVDLLAFETVPCLKEAQAIVRLLETEGYGVPAWISFSCRDGERTNHGEGFATECVPAVASCRAVEAVGVNCTAPRFVPQLLRSARDAVSGLRGGAGAEGEGDGGPVLLCYPNSGEGWDAVNRCWLPLPGLSEPEGYAGQARQWVKAGARLVGGCCRTTPAHIAQLRRQLLD